MPCFRPLSAWQRVTPGPNGKREIFFSTAAAQRFAVTPLTLPCGQCVGCRLDRAKGWALRCAHEALSWDQKAFLTLTYNPANLPPGGTLYKKHFQDFMKRLRFHYANRKIRYYMVGEYGAKGDRPHYHAIVYGVDFEEDRVLLKKNRGNPLYRSPTLDRLWGHGFASIGNVTFQSASYCARYCLKKITGEQAKTHYQRVDTETGEIYQVLPEYNNMSLKPGIGQGFFEEYSEDIFPHDYCILEGKKVRTPRYYDRLLEKENPALLEKVKLARKRNAKKQAANSTPERLAVRETVLDAKLSKLHREIE